MLSVEIREEGLLREGLRGEGLLSEEIRSEGLLGVERIRKITGRRNEGDTYYLALN